MNEQWSSTRWDGSKQNREGPASVKYAAKGRKRLSDRIKKGIDDTTELEVFLPER